MTPGMHGTETLKSNTLDADVEVGGDANYRLHRRFDRMGRLVGDEGMARLLGAHVAVIGLGGVGSWAAESLARSGIGTLTVIDFDDICVTNFNRQIHALQGLVGQKKATVLGERLQKINPQAKVHALATFYAESNSTEILDRQPGFDYVVDAIDHVTAKCHLLAECKRRGIPVITSTGSGGRMDPTQIKITDLAKTEHDPLARQVRRILREKYAFPANGAFGIPALYSTEPVTAPKELTYDGGKGFKCVCPQGQNGFFECDSRNLILGNASFVTGAFGLAAAAHVVRDLLSNPLN